MHLLQLYEHGLTKHDSDHIPPYAILSHVGWPDDQEPTFSDVANNSGRSKPGFAKLLFCGEQASRDGLQYFWVDTCCINQNVASEFSEALDFKLLWMFPLARVAAPIRRQAHTRKNFEWGKWFTYGWTLQELLSPSSMEFYSREGDILGTKESLELLIRAATDIPLALLRGAPLSDFTPTERLGLGLSRKSGFLSIDRRARNIFQHSYNMVWPDDRPDPLDWSSELQKLDVHNSVVNAKLEGHERGITSVAFAPDGQALASTSNDQTVRLWNPQTEHPIATSATSSGGVPFSEELVSGFVAVLYCNNELSSIYATAIRDPTIGATRLRRNVRRLIAKFGKALELEINDKAISDTARILQSRSISTRAAFEVIEQARSSDSQRDGNSASQRLLDGKSMVAAEHSHHQFPKAVSSGMLHEKNAHQDRVSENEQSGELASVTEGEEEAEISIQRQFDSHMGILLGSHAYSFFTSQLLQFAHAP
nr:vegetative incompatibility protein het-e-1 [Quercus suber]